MLRIQRVLGYSSAPQILQTVVLALTVSRVGRSSHSISTSQTEKLKLPDVRGLCVSAVAVGVHAPGPCRVACDASGRADMSVTDR